MFSASGGSTSNLMEGNSDGTSKTEEANRSQKSSMWGQSSNFSTAEAGAGRWDYSGADSASFGGTNWSNTVGPVNSGKTNDDNKVKPGQNNSGSWNQAGSSGDNNGGLWDQRERNFSSSMSSLDSTSISEGLSSNIWDKDSKLEPSTLWGNVAWEGDSGSMTSGTMTWGVAGASEMSQPNAENRSLWNRPSTDSKWISGNPPASGADTMFQESLWQQGSAASSTAGDAAGASAVGRPLSKDEQIAKYVNSHEGWGKTPIRQDIPWDLTEETRPAPVPDASRIRQRSQSSSNGVAIWESSRTTSVSDGSSDWGDSDNEGGGHHWHRGSESGHSRGSKDEQMGGTTNSVWNDGNSSIKTETGFWQDAGGDSGTSSRMGNAFDATISTWEENTAQDNMRGSRGGGDGGMDAKPGWPKGGADKSLWGDNGGGSIGNWGDSSSSASSAMPQKVDDGTASWGNSQIRPDSWNDGAAKQRSSPVEWNSQQNWSSQAAMQKKLQQQQQQQPQQPNRSAGPMQMRSQMLQDLVRRGFKKEEAQEALIRHNMDFDNALAELSAVASGQRFGSGGDMMKGRKLLGANSDLGLEGHMDSMSRGLPPMGIQQQSQLSTTNPTFPNTAIPPPLPGFQGVQTNSNPLGVPGLAGSLQQSKAMHPNQQQQSAQGVGAMRLQMDNKPDVTGANGLQLQQQQLLQQLQLAVQQGQISPTMLAQYQQNPSQMVNIGNLAQLQSVLSRLMVEHQQVQSSRSMNPVQQQQQLDKLTVTIQQLRAQIKQQQMHILAQTTQQPANVMGQQQQSGNIAGKTNVMGMPQQQSGMFSGMGNESKPFPRDLNNAMNMMSLKDNQMGGGQNVDTSQLSKWRMPSPEKEMSSGGRFSSLGQANMSGSGTLPHVASASDLGLKQMNFGGLTHNSSAPDLQTQVNQDGSVNQASLEFEEFVPGRPWCGMAKSTDDDPYLTPGQVAGRISMNRINDDYVMNTLGKTQVSGGHSANDINMAAQMATNAAKQQQMMSAQGRGWGDQPGQQWNPNSGGQQQAVRPGQQQQPAMTGNQQRAQWNRNMPVTPQVPPAAPQAGFAGGPPRVITWLLLTNVGPQVDLNVLKMHGACKLEPLGKPGDILAGFTSRDGAIRAYSAIQAAYANVRGPKINVEVVSDTAVQQLLLMMRGGLPQWSPNVPPPMMAGGGMSSAGPWDEHTNQLLPGDLLGGP